MLYRTLGRTGVKVSVLGIGGAHLGGAGDQAAAERVVRTAVDRGVTFLDNCWDYNGGRSEEYMGAALKDGYRQKVFLMTKFDGRTRMKALDQLTDSLRRLKTDHVDLWQFHENIRMDDPDRFFAKGGAVEAVTEAQKAGKVRFVGFTGHKDPAIHLRMLEAAARQEFRFDACQMPVNVMDYHFKSFSREVMPRLLQSGVAALGMKPLGGGILLKSNILTAPECLRWALSQPVSVVITGIESMERLTQALELVRDFRPMAQSEADALLARTKEAASAGKYELFKTTGVFDGTAQHPEWMG